MAEVARLSFDTIERPFIAVDFAGDVKKLPLTFDAADLDLMGSGESGTFIKFVRKYLGDEVMDAIGDDVLKSIISTWSNLRAEMGEPDMGESSALPA